MILLPSRRRGKKTITLKKEGKKKTARKGRKRVSVFNEGKGFPMYEKLQISTREEHEMRVKTCRTSCPAGGQKGKQL